jgi:hypothetical protein
MQKLFSTGMSFVKCSIYNKLKVKFVFSAEDEEHNTK